MKQYLSLKNWTKITFFLVSLCIGIFIRMTTESSWSGLIIISLVFLFLIVFERQLKIKIPVSIAAVFVGFIVFTLVLGSKYGFYEMFPWWDDVLHTFYGWAFAFLWFLLIMYISFLRGVKNDIVIICLFSFSIAVAGWAIWEIYEYSYDYLTQTGNMQRACVDGTEITRYSCAETNLRGVNDTMSDIIVETSAALFVNIFIFLYLAFGNKNWVGRMHENFIELNTEK